MMTLSKIGESRELVKGRCSKIFFRQSMINDIMLCPKMAMYKWVMGLEETSPYMAAILGTAGHEVMFEMHWAKKFNYTPLEMMRCFESYFNQTLESLTSLPVVGKNYGSIKEEFLDRCVDYVEMLMSYQDHPKTKEFKSTMHEQSFVLEVADEEFPLETPFLFSGQLDQAGYYIITDEAGNKTTTFALRDIKFRDNAFKPDLKAFNFNPQMTIYAAALKYGNPACERCKPRYEENDTLGTFDLVYNGPCEICRSKIGTPLWPRLFPERCELIWMRDFMKYKRRYKGKEKGDRKGSGYIYTYRSPQRLSVLMRDVVSICRDIRSGSFHRKPGPHCNLWCKYYDSCRMGIECDAEALKNTEILTKGLYSDEDKF